MIKAYIRRIPDYLVRDLPPLAIAMATAEIFFKFGSFTLECLAFLVLWYVLAQIYEWMFPRLGARDREASALRRADDV
jgi:hypothetical protein